MKRDSIDFEHGDVMTLFRRILLPTLLGSLAISAMTTIDGIFVGHGVGAEGVAAVNITVPMYMVMSGLGLMMGAGCSVVSSIHMARQQLKAARLNITQAILTASLCTIPVAAIVMLYPEHTARFLGASPTLLPQVTDYLMWIMPSFLFEMWSMIGLFVIRLDGAPRYAMWCNVVPAILNVVLDWFFIIHLDMGVEGAAIATSVCIIFGGLMAMCYLLFAARRLRLLLPKISRKSLQLSVRNIGYQCRIGFSTLLGELTLAVFIFVGNWQFMRYLGDAGVGAFGIACYYAPFFFMIGNSIAQSAQPILSYNYGANRWHLVQRTRRLLLSTSIAFGCVISLLFLLTPRALVGLFITPHSTAGAIAIEGFPLFGLGIVCFILNVALTGYLQSIERVRMSILCVALRGFALLIPCFVLLPLVWGSQGIWLAMPLAETATLTIVAILLRRQR